MATRRADAGGCAVLDAGDELIRRQRDYCDVDRSCSNDCRRGRKAEQVWPLRIDRNDPALKAVLDQMVERASAELPQILGRSHHRHRARRDDVRERRGVIFAGGTHHSTRIFCGPDAVGEKGRLLTHHSLNRAARLDIEIAQLRDRLRFGKDRIDLSVPKT
jgi:hypothetical protein